MNQTADVFSRIDAFKAEEARQMRECMSNRNNYTIEEIREVIAYHEARGLSYRASVAREILAERLAEQAADLLTAPRDQFTQTDTHDLKEGDIVLTHGMVVRIGAKQTGVATEEQPDLLPPLPEGHEAWQFPERIVYVSCNPSTLARDAGLLVHQAGYRCVAAGVVNMFPHTAHVESMAVFERAH